MNLINKEKINAYIMACYIFQFGILQPIASIVNSQLPTAVVTFALILIAFFNNQFRYKLYVVNLFLIIGVYFCLNMLIFTRNTDAALAIYIEYIIKGFSAVIIGSLTVNGKDLFKSFLQLAFINFLMTAFLPFTGYLDDEGYMRFGYAMIPSVLMFFYAFFTQKKHKWLWACLFTISLLLTVVYGNRGALLVFVVFVLFIFIFSRRIKLNIKIMILALVSMVSFVTIRYNFLTLIIDYIYYDLGITTYAIEKFRLQLAAGLEAASSGRGTIYQQIIEIAKLNLFTGNGVGITQVEMGKTAHNIFLQILVEAGYFGLMLWLFAWIFLIKKYVDFSRLSEDELFKIITIVLATALGRLAISSDMWLRPEYWFAISLLLHSATYYSEILDASVQTSKQPFFSLFKITQLKHDEREHELLLLCFELGAL